MSLVRWLHAPRKTSGAEEWLYSSRKWCSTSHTTSKPRRSASSTCSSASCIRRYSPSSSHGRGQLVLVEDRRTSCGTDGEELGQDVRARSCAGAHQNSTSPRAARRPSSRPGPRLWASSGSQIRPIMSVPGVRAPAVADPGAVAHFGERGAQVADVRRLVGPDVGDEPGGLAVAGRPARCRTSIPRPRRRCGRRRSR